MSFKGVPRPQYTSVIPAFLQLFEAGDIPKVFQFCEKRYHLSPKWYEQFKRELQKQARELPEQEFFFRWATEYINPALQILVRRNDNVLFDIARYIIKSRIEEKRKELEYKDRYYRNGQWKRDLEKE
jgi:hypothetical protein